MKKWNLIIDIEKCEDCNNCFLSCKDEHVDNAFQGYTAPQVKHGHRWVNIMRKERGQFPQIDVAYLPVFCMHCDNAPCITAAKDGAVYKRDDGIVIIDPVKAQGQKHLVDACPYGAIWWNEEHTLPQKCTLCAHLLDQGWKEPRCVQACPTGALRIVKVEDGEMQEIVKSETLEILHPEYNTRPRVYYKNLFRYTHCFIAGSVAVEKDGVSDCAQDAAVSLIKDSEKRQTTTDTFGDFRFDGLPENSGTYRVEITYEDRTMKTLAVEVDKSVSLGTVWV
ncbi:MAG TPA: 4Fe-4S dicluster domain-containing protein [Desulfatiglandales bacterium]|nr:4Fe-4S dicluster domain-containing protein [Desulfatiglandales bacterium]